MRLLKRESTVFSFRNTQKNRLPKVSKRWLGGIWLPCARLHEALANGSRLKLWLGSTRNYLPQQPKTKSNLWRILKSLHVHTLKSVSQTERPLSTNVSYKTGLQSLSKPRVLQMTSKSASDRLMDCACLTQEVETAASRLRLLRAGPKRKVLISKKN